jgi:murein DD-endopeptidase MepM/ murein hydrolase activator NlpD
MKEAVCAGRWTAVSRIVLVGLMGGAVSACSSDTMRLSEAFSNPFSGSERLASNEPAAPQQSMAAASVPTAPVQSRSLPPIQSQPLAPVQAAPPSRVASAPVTGGATGWTAAGGTRIAVAPDDNLNTISSRYGVPGSAILSANGFKSPSQIAPGAQVVIPVYHAGGTSSQVADAPPMPASQPKYRLVEGAKPAAVKSAAPADASRQRVRPGMAAAPSVPALAKAPPAAPSKGASQDPPLVAAPPQMAARTEPQPGKPAVPSYAPQPTPPQETAKAPSSEPDQTGALSGDFRWPARGKVIAGFGANGGNEGINIALPEGTPVKAAEAGTVTYAGDEVKGYGNLVLIRHDNGYVSAYAHNGSLQVKRGERVKRGQVVAISGQTGNVTSPQLHFELRKGQAPVDPMKHLSGS